MYLYLDSSEQLQVGLLNDSFEWIEFISHGTTKGSGVVHELIYSLLGKHQLKVTGLKGLIQISGPGSYTGMRLSEGLSQIFELENINVYSIYHFDVPLILGEKNGAWVSKAFKGEVFIHSWGEDGEKKQLVKEEAFYEMKLDNVYTHFQSNFNMEMRLTSELIHNNSTKIMQYLVNNNIRKEPYYYRALEDEFNVTQK